MPVRLFWMSRQPCTQTLRTLLPGTLLERSHHVEGFVPAVGTGELAIDENRTAAILSARRFRIGRDEAIDKCFDCRRFLRREKVPAVERNNWRRIGETGRPREAAFDHGGPRAWRDQQQRHRA